MTCFTEKQKVLRNPRVVVALTFSGLLSTFTVGEAAGFDALRSSRTLDLPRSNDSERV